jgi:hypothetical protein
MGGERHGDKGYFVQPTVFSGVTNEMSIGREEVRFGSSVPFSSSPGDAAFADAHSSHLLHPAPCSCSSYACRSLAPSSPSSGSRTKPKRSRSQTAPTTASPLLSTPRTLARSLESSGRSKRVPYGSTSTLCFRLRFLLGVSRPSLVLLGDLTSRRR